MTEQGGLIREVVLERTGSAVAQDTASVAGVDADGMDYYYTPISATTLPLEDCYEFEERGGQIRIDLEGDVTDPIISYTGYDDDLSILYLTVPLAFSVPVGTSVYVWPESIEKRAWVTIMEDEGGDPIEARIPFSMNTILAEGIRTDATGYESAVITLDGEDWVVTDILGEPAFIDAGMIDPTTYVPITSLSDGQLPQTAPVVTAVSLEGVVSLAWAVVPNRDPIRYKIYGSITPGFTPGPSNLINELSSLSMRVALLGGAPLSTSVLTYFRVSAVDADGEGPYSNEVSGTPVVIFVMDTVPPNAPTSVTTAVGFDTARQQAYLTVTWVASSSSDVRNYTIRFAPTAASNWNYVTVNSDAVTARIDINPAANYYVGVQSVDFVGNKSAFVNSATYPHLTLADTTAPSTPAAPTAVGNTLQVQVSHSDLKADNVTAIETDTAYYEVYASKTTGFTTYNSTTLLGKLIKSNVTSAAFYLPVTTTSGTVADDWFIKVKAVDRTGNASAASAQTTVTPGLITNANIVNATINNAKIVDLEAGKVTADSAFIADLKIGQASGVGTNQATNPGFEIVSGSTITKPAGGTAPGVMRQGGGGGVTAGGSAVNYQDTAWFIDGANSIAVDAGSATTASTAVYPSHTTSAMDLYGFIPGKTYTVQATIRLIAAQTGSLDSQARKISIGVTAPSLNGGADNYVYAASNQAPNSAAVTALSVTFTVPLDATKVWIRLMNGENSVANSGGGGKVWYDGFSVAETTYTGSISSHDFVSGQFGFKLDGDELEIVDGTIKARAVELRNGANLMSQEYAEFEFRPSYYTNKLSVTNGTVQVNTNSPKFNTQNLTLFSNTGAQGKVYLGVGPDSANIDIEGGREYILSAYLMSVPGCSAQIGVRFDDGTEVSSTPSAITGLPHQRKSFTLTAPAAAEKLIVWVAGTTNGAAFDADGIQLEERYGKLTTPTQWLPPSSTSIDGGQIKTGSIESTYQVDIGGGQFVPAWFINTAGTAQFSDATILGVLNVGTASEFSGLSKVQSANYSEEDGAEAGWKIDSSGLAIFNDAITRGDITAANAAITENFSISGQGGAIASMQIGNSTKAVVAGPFSNPATPAIVATESKDIVSFPGLPTENVYGPVFITGGDVVFLEVVNTGVNVFFNRWRYTSAGVFVSTTALDSNIVAAENDPEIYGFSTHDGTAFTFVWRQETFVPGVSTPFTIWTLSSTWTWVSTNTFTDIAAYDYGYRPAFFRTGNDVWIARTRSPNKNINKCINPSFETASLASIDAYNAATTLARVANTSMGSSTNGSWCLRVTSNATSTASRGHYQFNVFMEGCAAGDKLVLRNVVRSASAAINRFRIRIQWQDGTYTYGTESVVGSTSNTTLTETITVPAGKTSYRVLYFFQKSSGAAFGVETVGYIDEQVVTNNGPFEWVGPVPFTTSTADTTTGMTYFRKYAISALTTIVQDNGTGQYLYSDMNHFYVGNGDYAGATFSINRVGNSQSYGLTSMNFINPGSNTSTLTSRDHAYLSGQGLAVDSSNRYWDYQRSGGFIQRWAKTFDAHTSRKLSVAYTYYDSNATNGTHETKIGPVVQFDMTWGLRNKVRFSSMAIPSIPGGVAATDTPNQIGVYVGYNTTDRTKMTRLISASSATGYYTPSGGVVSVTVDDLTLVPGGDNANVPRTVSSTGVNPPPTTNGFLTVGGFTRATIESGQMTNGTTADIVIGGDGIGNIQGLAFGPAGLVISPAVSAGSGQIASNTGTFLVKHDGTGSWLSMDAPPHLLRELTGVVTIGTTATAVAFATSIDADTLITNTSNNLFTIQKAGLYIINAQITWATNTTAGIFTILMAVNGVDQRNHRVTKTSANAAISGALSVTKRLAVGDTVQIKGESAAASMTISTGNWTFLDLTRIGS